MNINNTTVLITGGGSGIGLALAIALLKENAKVIICGRNQQKLDNAQLQVPELNLIQCDVVDETQVDNMIETVHSKFQGIDILINNAGIFQGYNVQNQNLPFNKIQQELAIDLEAPILLAAKFLPELLKKPEAAIVNVSSGLAYIPLTSHPVYCAAKAGLHSFTLSLRRQLKGTSVKVFELLAPLMDTELVSEVKMSGKVPPEKVAAYTVKCLKNNTYQIRPGMTKALYLMSRLAPGFMEGQVNKG
ncbi:MAG: SDR family NAD(P)-dependent oxidoreductase [Bacteroidetes bacterium]|nr:SDR family NAD(P)-dependent oxidoreductase [Bacteroidota bacterium]